MADPVDVFLLEVGVDLDPWNDVPSRDPDQEVADEGDAEERGNGGEHPPDDVPGQHCATLPRPASVSYRFRHLPSDTNRSLMKFRRPVWPMNVPYCQFWTRLLRPRIPLGKTRKGAGTS